jgi:hypothetical protein
MRKLTLVVVSVVLFASFVWPTPYRYQETTLHGLSGPKQRLVRINRLTGETHYLSSGGWASMR